MKTCPYCHKDIVRDDATVCPHCNRDLMRRARSEGAIPAAAPVAPVASPPRAADASPLTRVSVVDINMPFPSMVGFMVKWTLAALPAFVILAAIGFVVVAAFGGLASACAVSRPR